MQSSINLALYTNIQTKEGQRKKGSQSMPRGNLSCGSSSPQDLISHFDV